MMKVAEIVEVLEAVAPPRWAQDWDNVGLLVGDAAANVRTIMLCVDLTAAVLAEAVDAKAQMVVAYHPVIFKPIGRVTAGDSPVVYEAARRGVAVYSIHTAFDVVPGGTNDVLAAALGIVNARPLEQTSAPGQCKIVTFMPPDDLSRVANKAFAAGAGQIGNYYDCAFFSHGIGAFCGGVDTHPAIGRPGDHEMAEELRLEVIAPRAKVAAVCEAIRSVHTYETPAIDVYPLDDVPDDCGMGRVGPLARGASVRTLITRIKKATGLKKVLLARAAASGLAKSKRNSRVTTASCGAGSCGKLFRKAIAAGATFYLTGEMRHHDLLAATGAGLNVVCLGHSNSERIAVRALADRLAAMPDKITISVSRRDRDPLEIV